MKTPCGYSSWPSLKSNKQFTTQQNKELTSIRPLPIQRKSSSQFIRQWRTRRNPDGFQSAANRRLYSFRNTKFTLLKPGVPFSIVTAENKRKYYSHSYVTKTGDLLISLYKPNSRVRPTLVYVVTDRCVLAKGKDLNPINLSYEIKNAYLRLRIATAYINRVLPKGEKSYTRRSLFAKAIGLKKFPKEKRTITTFSGQSKTLTKTIGYIATVGKHTTKFSVNYYSAEMGKRRLMFGVSGELHTNKNSDKLLPTQNITEWSVFCLDQSSKERKDGVFFRDRQVRLGKVYDRSTHLSGFNFVARKKTKNTLRELKLDLLTNYNGNTISRVKNKFDKALRSAVRRGDVRTAKLLLRNGADVNSTTKSGRTLLHVAVSAGHVKIIRLLFSYRADINIKDNLGRTALHLAPLTYRSIDILKLLMAQGADSNIFDRLDKTALDYAIRARNTEAVKYLLARTLDLNRISRSDGTSVLFRAIVSGSERIVQLILAKDVNIELANRLGNTPLMLACLMRQNNIVSLLLSEGASITAQNNEGKRASEMCKIIK